MVQNDRLSNIMTVAINCITQRLKHTLINTKDRKSRTGVVAQSEVGHRLREMSAC